MRPSFQIAPGTPRSAAYSSAIRPWLTLPSRSIWLPERNASNGVAPAGGTALSAGPAGGAGTVASGATRDGGSGAVTGAISGVRVPSKLAAGEKPNAKPIRPRLTTALDVRIARLLSRPAGMGHRAFARRPDLLGIFPQIAGRELGRPRLPGLRPALEFGLAQIDLEHAFVGVDGDDVAVAHMRDRSADGGLGADMSDAEAAGGAGETSVGDEGDLAAHALSVERGGRCQHLAHARAALGALIADHEHVAFPVLAVLDRLEAGFFAVETTRRTGKFQLTHAGNLNNGTLGREIALETDDTAGDGQRLIGRTHNVLIFIPLNPSEIVADGAAGYRDALAVQVTVVEQRLHQQRDAASFEHVFGDITATGLQIRDIRCLFEDFRDVEEIEFDAAFMRDRRQVQCSIGRGSRGRDSGRRVLEVLCRDSVERA